MLISRALNRGYGASRYRWPMQFGQLHNDVVWLLDETQLMGVAVETSAQLEGLRRKLGTTLPSTTVWMSATLSDHQLGTVDHPIPPNGWTRFSLGEQDLKSQIVQKRTGARKEVEKAGFGLDKSAAKGDYTKKLAQLVLDHHKPETLTLVVVNRVQRAQDLYAALLKRGRTSERTALIHSRFRPPDRKRHESLLQATGDRIIVSTQAIEAGVDISSQTLITELAPWSSMVQRFGRCNRFGEQSQAKIIWVDVMGDSETLPYESLDMDEARKALLTLEDAGPDSIRRLTVPQRNVIRPVLRRKDLLDLFDTTPDLSGSDLDVTPYVRDGDDTDLQIFWRELNGAPPPDTPAPTADELCGVPVNAARGLKLWRWDALVGTWNPTAGQVRAGQVYLMDATSGGYLEDLGWSPKSKSPVPVVESGEQVPEQMDSEPSTPAGRWVPLSEHLQDVSKAARHLASTLGLPDEMAEALETVGCWHDVGKAHEAFQNGIGCPTDLRPCAKSPSSRGRVFYRMDDQTTRPGFRHELASALAWLQTNGAHPLGDLIGYLIASHHGKVRVSLRSMPNEHKPNSQQLYARGIWDGDVVPALPGFLNQPLALNLGLMQFGVESWLTRILRLRDDPHTGPFRLAFFEAIVRAADWSASKLEEERTPAHA